MVWTDTENDDLLEEVVKLRYHVDLLVEALDYVYDMTTDGDIHAVIEDAKESLED